MFNSEQIYNELYISLGLNFWIILKQSFECLFYNIKYDLLCVFFYILITFSETI